MFRQKRQLRRHLEPSLESKEREEKPNRQDKLDSKRLRTWILDEVSHRDGRRRKKESDLQSRSINREFGETSTTRSRANSSDGESDGLCDDVANRHDERCSIVRKSRDGIGRSIVETKSTRSDLVVRIRSIVQNNTRNVDRSGPGERDPSTDTLIRSSPLQKTSGKRYARNR